MHVEFQHLASVNSTACSLPNSGGSEPTTPCWRRRRRQVESQPLLQRNQHELPSSRNPTNALFASLFSSICGLPPTLQNSPLKMTKFWNVSSCSWAQVILYYTRLYGVQILLITVLSAVTVYRREMSCNHVYAEDETGPQRLSTGRTPTKSSQNKNEGSLTFWDDLVWDDLERAGNYCSGEPLIAVAMKLWTCLFFGSGRLENPENEAVVSSTSNDHGHVHGRSCRPDNHVKLDTQDLDILAQQLPPDLQVQILSYLHPRDVVTFACASHSCRNIVEFGDTSMALWKTLWYRDYSWVVLSWEVGHQALQRSRRTGVDVHFGKHFYFTFGQSYLDYVLAGRNTADLCLVGLHGHIYDITPFLHLHPGSPDTLLVHAGRDATAFFEDMGHSVGARKIARSLCLVVDVSRKDIGCGIRPTKNILNHSGLPPRVEGIIIPTERSHRRAGTLERLRNQYDSDRQRNLKRVMRQFAGDPNVLSHVNVYYDPMCMEWRAWFTDVKLETVFCNAR